MATITVRNLSDSVVENLKERAKYKGISMEQEVRNIITNNAIDKLEVLKRIEASCKNHLKPITKEIAKKYITESKKWRNKK